MSSGVGWGGEVGGGGGGGGEQPGVSPVSEWHPVTPHYTHHTSPS